ncbi:MAG: signal transduction protein [Gammaproteobacteria bacterium]|nr:MAG: signal transduction protein [Gammaproteobacteria bacterium]TND04418.1 MAG: signal transduction protein [Gammaproteobacteria bacterium]
MDYHRALAPTGLAVFLVVFSIGDYALGFNQWIVHWWADMAWTLASGVTALMCYGAARKLSGHERAAWLLFAAGCLAWFLGMLAWDYLELVAGRATPFPSVSDFGFLLLPPLFMAGLIYWRQSAPSAVLTLKHVSNLGFVLCALIIVFVLVLSERIQESPDGPWYIAVTLAMPVLYLGLLIFGLYLLYSHRWGAQRPAMLLLVAGMAVHGITNTIYAHELLTHKYLAGHYLDVFWLLGFAFFFWAALEKRRQAAGGMPTRASRGMPRDAALVEGLLPAVALVLIVVVAATFGHAVTRQEFPYLIPAGIGLLAFLLLWEWAKYRVEQGLVAAARESGDRLESLVRNIPGAIYRSRCVIGKDWSMTYVSEAMTLVTGYPASEFTGGSIKSYAQLVHPDDLAGVEQRIRHAIDRRRPYELEYRIIDANGAVRWLYERGQAHYSASGTPDWLDGAIFDVTVRKKAEIALQDREEKFRSLVENAESVILYLSPDGDILEFNPAAERLYGARRRDVLGRNYFQLFVPEPVRDAVIADMRQVMAGTPTRGYENEVLAADGKRRILAWYVNRVLSTDGQPAGVVAMGHDVTETKAADAALVESRRLLQLVLDAIPVRVFWKDRESRYLGCNRLFALDAGLMSPAGIHGASDFDLGWREQAERYLADDHQVMTTGVPKFDYEEPQTTPDGRHIWLRTSKVPLTDSHGGIIGVLGTYEDVTGQREMEQKAAERNLRLQRLSELGLTLSGDPKEVFRQVSRMIGELLGVPVVCLSEIADEQVYFVAVYAHGEVTVDAGSLPLAGTPCAAEVETGEVHVYQDVTEKFPGLEMLERYNASTYCGFPALDQHGNVVAITCLIDDQRREFTEEDLGLLRIFGQRIGMEIERQRHINEHAIADAQMKKLSGAIEQTADIVLISDREGRVEYVNPAFEAATGYTLAEVKGKKSNVVRSGKHDDAFYQGLWDTITRGDVFQDVVINRKKSGDIFYEEKTITPLKDGTGNITHFISTGKDITERMQIQERLYRLAYHDILTDLPNRALFVDRLDHALARQRDGGRCMAVLFMDLDRFKNINDTLGHDIGDRLLQMLSERLLESLRDSDTVARLAGDEFVILLEEVDAAGDVAPICRKILDALSRPFVVNGNELYMTSSIGISLYPSDGTDASILMRNADVAMYRAKELGRNNFQFYSADMSARAFERLTLETSLRHALERDEFLIHYQPQICLDTGRIIGVEALLRWQHPDFGLVQPGEFIPLLEETGLIVPVGEWVLRTAMNQAVAWQAVGLDPIRVAINLSSRQFDGRQLLDTVLNLVKETGLETRWLELEITESLLMNNERLTLEMLQALSDAGIRLSIDDFGTGYSSLGYLKRFPIDTLKIDRSFVRDITTDPDDAAIVTAIIAMATSLKLDVIAEGVETRAQLDFLKERQCVCLQGYLFSRPLPVDGMTALLRRDRTERIQWQDVQ